MILTQKLPKLILIAMLSWVSSSVVLGQSDNSGLRDGGESIAVVTKLPVTVTKTLLQAFSLSDVPTLSLSSINSQIMEVSGLPKEKLAGLFSDYFANYQNRMSSEDYLKYVLPGPGISGDEKLDAERYYNVLKQFRLRFPETLWYQPKDLEPMFSSLEGASELMKMQVLANHSITLQATDAPLPTEEALPASNDKLSNP